MMNLIKLIAEIQENIKFQVALYSQYIKFEVGTYYSRLPLSKCTHHVKIYYVCCITYEKHAALNRIANEPHYQICQQIYKNVHDIHANIGKKHFNFKSIPTQFFHMFTQLSITLIH